ncbi:MAG: recombination protein RecR [Candidatus Liptonbacteria bacterium]|nr:recombination protein RecR [Candidatus Liptonbacteria bacterium]
MLPDPIKKFADVFGKLPSIGPRQALRLAFYLAGEDRGLLREVESAAKNLNSIKICGKCFYTHTQKNNLCEICVNQSRNQKVIAILEKSTDLMSLEKTKKFGGRYLVLGNLQKNGVMDMEQKLRLETLKRFIAKELCGKADEIILAINPTAYGNLNAAMLQRELTPFTAKLSRLGRGIPTGGEIEFADEETLGAALERRS